jgi:hypothetical protein
MAEAVYLLCAITSLSCAVLLVRSWLRSRTNLLLWSSVCFVVLTVNNALLVVDEIVAPHMDLSLPRTLSALAAVFALLIGLIWNSR